MNEASTYGFISVLAAVTAFAVTAMLGKYIIPWLHSLKFGTSILYPGKVGDEYHMTKGHFHTILETAEVYYCLSGEGYMMMENPEGDVRVSKLVPGEALYVPERYAHRSINTGSTPLVTFFVFRGDAGHNYGTIETKGYRKLIVEKDGRPEIVDNPKWKAQD